MKNNPVPAMSGNLPKALYNAMINGKEAHQNQIVQYLSNLELANSFTLVFFNLVRLEL